MSRTQPAHSSAETDTSRFLSALFGEDRMRAWVTAFTQDPFAPSALTDKAKASKLSAKMWAGGVYRTQARRCTDDANQYVAISIFKAAPWTDRDGVEHITPKRRKSHFERACAVMIDDIGKTQKVKPSAIKLPLTATVETSPGNCQGWYALDPEDDDSHNAELVARLIDRMVAAGLTKDLTDPGMRGVTRYGRLPGGINNKPGRDPWGVKLRDLKPKRVYTVQQIADAYALDLTAPPERDAAPHGQPAESLVTKLADAGLKPVAKAPGVWDITCPWTDDHTDKVDSGTAYFEPSRLNGFAGGFHCHHGHCENHGIGDLFRWLELRDLGKALKASKGAKGNTPKPVAERRKEFTFAELMATEHAPIPWLVEGMVCPGLTLLAAPPKMGKSYFVLQMGMCVAAGVPFLGRKTTRSKVSYFDLEEWEEMLQPRVVDIMKAHGIKNPDLRFQMEMTGDDVTVLDDLQRHIDEGAKLLIIDLLARVRDELNEDAKKNAYARDYAVLRNFADFILTRNPGVSIVMVHHTNKGQHDDWQSKISGSQGLAGATHCNMLLANLDLRGLDDDARKETLKHRRFHYVGKAVQGDELILKMMDNRGGWEVTERTTDEIKMTSRHAQVLQVLREADGRWVTAKEVHAVTEGTLDSVKKMLLRMARKGEIESSGSGGAGYRMLSA